MYLLKGKIENVDDFRKYIRPRLLWCWWRWSNRVYICEIVPSRKSLEKLELVIWCPWNEIGSWLWMARSLESSRNQLSILKRSGNQEEKYLRNRFEETRTYSFYVNHYAYKIASSPVYGYSGFEKTVLYDKDPAEAMPKSRQILLSIGPPINDDSEKRMKRFSDNDFRQCRKPTSLIERK